MMEVESHSNGASGGYTYAAAFDQQFFRQPSLSDLTKVESALYANNPALHKQLSIHTAMDPSIFFATENGGNATNGSHRYYDHDVDMDRTPLSHHDLDLPIATHLNGNNNLHQQSSSTSATEAAARQQLQHAVQQHHQHRRYDSADGATSIVTTDTDDITTSPSSSIPPLSPFVGSPHSMVHHATSPFKHSAADVLTSEFALPPPMQSSSSSQQYESVGKLSRYITADDTQPVQIAPQYYQQGTILHQLSPLGQRSIQQQQYVHNNHSALPRIATQLGHVIRNNHRSVKQESSSSAAAAQSYPLAPAIVPKSQTSSSLSTQASTASSTAVTATVSPRAIPIHPDDLPLRYHQQQRQQQLALPLSPASMRSQKHSLPVPAVLDQRHTSASSQLSHSSHPSSVYSHHHTYKAGTKTNNAHTMVLGADGQLKQRRSRGGGGDGYHSSYASPTLSAVSVGSSNSSNASVGAATTKHHRTAKQPTTHHTRGHLTTDMSHKYYYDDHDVEHSIRILTVTNHETHAVESFVHAADLGGVVERKSNISRLFGQFHSPSEKVLMNVTGSHNHSIGQESNVLTRAGVLRFFECSKMRGQTQYREWIEDVILLIFEQNKSATVIENIEEVSQQLAAHGEPQQQHEAATPPASVTRPVISKKHHRSSTAGTTTRSSNLSNRPKRRKSLRLSSRDDVKDSDDDDEAVNDDSVKDEAVDRYISESGSEWDGDDSDTYRGR